MNFSPSLPERPVVPDHQLERRIGRGGYGEIWLARNIIGTYRAVKVVYRSRFESPKPYEREFTGLKTFEPVSRNHPGFVHVLQVGQNEEAGYIYYVMELADDEVSGRVVDPDTYSAKNLARERDKLGRLRADECLKIALSLASALSHLHKAGLVHRDIKPSNIIFVNGQPKLADIGLVKAISEVNTFVGSDGYIPPEGPGTFQADIYSLGKLLYEISTGQNKDQFPELPRDIAQFEDAAAILELNEVTLKACENDRRRRYATIDELRADLEMIAAGRSVKQLRFIERQLARVQRVAGAAIVFAIIAIIFASVVVYLGQQKNKALAEAYVSGGVQMVEAANVLSAVPLFTAALRLQGRDSAAAEAHRLRIGTALAHAPKLLQFWDYNHTLSDVRFSRDGGRLLVAGGRAIRLLDVNTGELRRELTMPRTVASASFNADGKRFAVANDKYITLFDSETGAEIYDLPQQDPVPSAEFNPDATRLILGCAKACVHVLDAATGQQLALLNGHRAHVGYAAFSPDGTRIVTASRDGTARLWDARTFEPQFVLPHPSSAWVTFAAFSPDGRRVATALADNTVLVWEISESPHTNARMTHDGSVQSVSFSPDGHWLLTAGLDHTVRIWDSRTGRPGSPRISLQAPALRAAFSPEGRRAAVVSHNGRVTVWDVSESMPLDVGPGIVSSDGQRYITYTSNSFRVWDARNDRPITSSVEVSQTIASVSCSADGRTIAVWAQPQRDRTATILVHDVNTGSTRSFVATDTRQSGLLSPDGRKLLCTNGPVATVWDTQSGRMIFERRDFPARIDCVAFSPDSRAVAISSSRGVHVLDAEDWTERFAPRSNALRVVWLAFSRNSSKLVATTRDRSFSPGMAIVYDANTGDRLNELAGHSDGLKSAAFTGDARRLATAGEDGLAFVWDLAKGTPLFEPCKLSQSIQSVNFTQDDAWLSASSWHYTRLWETQTGRALTPRFAIPGPGVFDEIGIVGDRNRLWGRTSRGLLFWDLPRATESPDELLAWANHLGVPIPVGVDWNTNDLSIAELRARSGKEQVRFANTLPQWHAQLARRFEHEQDWFGARFHLEQLMKLIPNDLDLRRRVESISQRLHEEISANPASASPPAP